MTGRVVFLIRVPEEKRHEFLAAYEQVRYEVAAGVPGHLLDQVCQSTQDPEQWLITSEWDDLESFAAWEASEEHRDLVRPMRACFTDAKSLRFIVRAETGKTVMEKFTDEDVRALLKAIGCDAPEPGRSFEELDVDSLARVEMASRIRTRYGLDVEEEITAELSPDGMRVLVNQRLAEEAAR